MMILENENTIAINPINALLSSAKGINSVLLQQGEAKFDSLILYGTPGEPNVLFKATTNAIDTAKIQEIFGDQLSDNIIKVSFRQCKPGEIIIDNHWSEWSAGTFSLDWSAIEWKPWLDEAVWDGKDQIAVKPGYWRRTTNSTKIVKCLNEDACKGGYYPESENPVECSSGYEGNLWTKWQVTKDHKYQRVSDYLWEKWPDPALNAIKVVGVGLIVFTFFMIIIIINIRKKRESEVSILLRILTNYLQLLSSSLSFQANYPSALGEIFYPVDKVGSSSNTFLSFDCFVTNVDITGPFPSNTFFKLFLTALLPLIIFGVVVIIWMS